MNVQRLQILFLTLLGFASDAHSAMRHPFSLSSRTWNATHIVVVTEGDKIDGVVEILESWKGDLKKGDRLTIPALAWFASRPARKINLDDDQSEPKPGDPTHVSCSRMVLFLIREHQKGQGNAANDPTWIGSTDSDSPPTWRRSQEALFISVAWIEAGRVFAMRQFINPGPVEIFDWSLTEREMRREVDDLLRTKPEIIKAIALSDPNKVADAALPLIRGNLPISGHRMIGELGELGRRGVPALRRILQDDSLIMFHISAMRRLTDADRVEAGPVLTAIIKRQRGFWSKRIAQKLEEEWWLGTGVAWWELPILQHRYSYCVAALRNLETLKFGGCRETVSALRDDWSPVPKRGQGEIVDICDRILKEIP
jgi:hypothetical protein